MNKSDVANWCASYKQAWEKGDKALFLSLFNDAADYQESPYQKPFHGAKIGEAWDDLRRRYADNTINFDVWVADGDKAIVNWDGSSTWPEFGPLHGNGVAILHFGKDNRCRSFRQWHHWHPPAAPKTRGFVENPIVA